jgi:hypothetical protein
MMTRLIPNIFYRNLGDGLDLFVTLSRLQGTSPGRHAGGR